MDSILNIFISVGEASGDNLGYKLINAIKALNNNVIFTGIAGPKMMASGMESIFPYEELSIMGFVEIIPRVSKILFRLYQTIKYIKKTKPDILITIDSPGFNFILAKKVKKLNLNIRLIHYVAPTVWAYRPERAKKISDLFDHLLVILPFERDYFVKEGLKTTYIGHPVIEDHAKFAKTVTKHSFNSILLLPGSRIIEIKTLLPIFLKSISIIDKQLGNFKIYISSLPNLIKYINEIMSSYEYDYTVICEDIEKTQIYSTIDFAICKSGTVSLEIAMAKIPMIIAYKINFISAYFLKKMITIKYVNLINIISNEEIIPELIQENCTASKIASEAIKLIDNKSYRDRQIKKSQNIFEILGLNDELTPSEKAANVVLNKSN